MRRWLTNLRQATRLVGFRAAMFSLAGIGIAIAAWIVSFAAPDNFGLEIGQDSVSTILQILASSMLAVTTFSLTTMVSAYSGASTSGTPRSTQLLILEPTSQNALSTFIGAFAYSIVGIIVLSMKVLSPAGIALLFLGTLAVTVTVLVALLRWISFLTTFGRVPDIIDRVEKAATSAMKAYAQDPSCGASAWTEPPPHARPILSDADGYVTDLHVTDLQAVAKVLDLELWVEVRPGATIAEGEPLAYVVGDGDGLDAVVRDSFGIDAHRTFDNDPRIGLIALSEVASKALSPGINDPGTAIDTLRAIERVLRIAQTADAEAEVTRPRLHLRSISAEDFVIDGLRPVSRDGAGMVEVAVRLQREIARLVENAPDAAWADALTVLSADAVLRSESAMTLEADILAVRSAHRQAVTARPSSPRASR